ncbi:MAG: hypothetical protein QM780_02645 [Hyphomicrobium sp.]|uniref:hypothetical protein n=1 Tax=Hyphomicrobium sp. TaxID=82 RepID=UPI0039E21F88
MLYRFRWFMIAFSTVLALAPFSGIAAAALLAAALGCTINDAAAEPCRMRGIDLGPVLSDLTVTAGLGEVVFVVLAVVLVTWMAAEGVAFVLRRWRRDGAAS